MVLAKPLHENPKNFICALWNIAEFLIQKCEFLGKVKEIKKLRGGILKYAAQAISAD